MPNRLLHFDGCTNARDLGGIPLGQGTLSGAETRWKTLVRSDTPARLSPAGWTALHDYGIRTILSLHTHGLDEPELLITPPFADIRVQQAAIEDVGDIDFVRRWASTGLWGTPLYYADALQRWPERHAAVIRLIAEAPPGGVLFHCVRGVDRTGVIAVLLLALAGVAAEEILDDYELSADEQRERLLQAEGTTTRQVILDVLAGLDAERYLLDGGASAAEIAAVRRLLVTA